MWDNPVGYLVVFGLATWRISYMLVNERGPDDIFVKLREWVEIGHDEDYEPISYPDTFFANLFGCVYCLSMWVAAAFVFLSIFLPFELMILLAMPFALSTIAVIIDTYTEKY